MKDLLDIPASTSEAAAEILKRQFDEKGDLRIIAMRPRICEIEQGLYQLCAELAERYHVVFSFEAVRGNPVQIDYSYRQHFFARRPRRRDRLKDWLGAQPSAFLVHIPLSRICDSYSFSMDAPDGYYFYEERVLEQNPSAQPHTNENTFSGPSYDVFAENLENVPEDRPMVTREKGGGTSAYLFVREGRSREKSLFAGFRVFEIPPGTTGRVFVLLLAGLIIDALFLIWENYYGASASTADVPALLVGVVSVLSVVAEAMLPRAEIVPCHCFRGCFCWRRVSGW